MKTASTEEKTAPFEQVTVPTGDGSLAAEMHASPGPDAAKLLWLPGLGIAAHYYRRFGAALAAGGIHTMVLDLRGQGASRPGTGRGSDHGYRQLIEVDTPAALSVLRAWPGDGPVLLGGHSLGGQVAVLHAADPGTALAGLVLVAAQTPHYRAYAGFNRLRMLLGTQAVAAIATLCGYWPGHRLGFGGRQPRRLIRDWARAARTGQWKPAGSRIDYGAALGRIALPVLAVSVADDADAPPSAVDRLCAPLQGCAVTRWHYQPEDPAAGGHFRWARGGCAPLAHRIVAWVEATTGQNAHGASISERAGRER